MSRLRPTYCLLLEVDLTPTMVAECLERSRGDVRSSNDGLMVGLKWMGAAPPSMAGFTPHVVLGRVGTYTFPQIVEVEALPGWRATPT